MFVIFQVCVCGGGVQTPCPPSGSVHDCIHFGSMVDSLMQTSSRTHKPSKRNIDGIISKTLWVCKLNGFRGCIVRLTELHASSVD